MKYSRQNLILRIIREEPISTHSELIAALARHGINVTQATVSRDIKALGLIKVPSGGGSVYAMPNNAGKLGRNMLENTVISVKSALHTVVIKTHPGMAEGICAVIDEAVGAEMLGSIAGDDTILIITESADNAEKLCREIKDLIGLKESKDA